MKKLFSLLIVLFIISIYSTSFAVDMFNTLAYTGKGVPNTAYNKQIKNIMIFHAGGWKYWYEIEDGDSTWSEHWGKGPSTYDCEPGKNKGYMYRDNDVYRWQMYDLKVVNENTAVAVLLMPDSEAGLGYGAKWISNCEWKRPKALYGNVMWAAWMNGVVVAPMISINDFDNAGPGAVLGKVIEMTEFVKQYNSLTSLKTPDGKLVVMIEGLPWRLNLSPEQIQAINDYMASQTDIFWINNITDDCFIASNVYRSAASSAPGVQDFYKENCNGRYLWHYANRYGRSFDEIKYFLMEDQLKWLNISPHDPEMYPVIISQWNEYSEFLIWEPNEFDGYREFWYLKWRLSQQP